MSVQRTDRVLTCFRIGDPDGTFPIYDSDGARLYPGRWNTHTSPIIYTSEHYSTAMLEKLVHANLVMPANLHFIRITIPNGVSYEMFQTAAHPGWDSRNETLCKEFGAKWYDERRSALLIVPSIPARLEHNVLINPGHPDSAGITHTMPEPVWWDKRLYGPSRFEAAEAMQQQALPSQEQAPSSPDQFVQGPMPSATYRLIAKAMAERKQVLCVYAGFERAICPIVLGHTKGEERTLAYQFAGGTSGGLPRGGQWKCLDISKMSDVQLRSGRWYAGASHRRPQACVREVDLDVNPQSPYQPRRQLSRSSRNPQPSGRRKKS